MIKIASLLYFVAFVLYAIAGIAVTCLIVIGIYWLFLKSIAAGLMAFGLAVVVGWILPLAAGSLMFISGRILDGVIHKVKLLPTQEDENRGTQEDNHTVSSLFPEGRYRLTYPIFIEQKVNGSTMLEAENYVMFSDNLDELKGIALVKGAGGYP
jgi:hypothetical protein